MTLRIARKQRQLLATRIAPGRPEREDQDTTGEIRSRDLLAIQRGESCRRRGRTDVQIIGQGKRRTQAYGTVLSDAEATRLFNTYCSRSYAGSFTLYKLYARAAAFTGTAP